MKDDTKKRILARRAHLVAAALGVVACEPKPEPCLSVVELPPPPDASSDSGMDAGEPEPPPLPCLSPMVADRPDTGAPQPTDAGPPPPLPCLSPPVPTQNPPPKVCLSVKRTK